MKKYFYSLLMGLFLMFIMAAPVLAIQFDEVLVSYDVGIPNASIEVQAPDLRIESVYHVESLSFEERQNHAAPLDQLLPRPGWQSESARETYHTKQKDLISKNRRV